MGIGRMFDEEKMKTLDNLVRSIEKEQNKFISEVVDEAVNNEVAEAIKTINDAFLTSAASIAEKMLLKGDSHKDVMKYTGLDEKEVLLIKARLEENSLCN